MEKLLGKTLTELQSVAQQVGLPKFAGKQLAEWLYVRRVSSFDEMTNISLKGREALKAHYTIGRSLPIREAVSADGTRKYLFPVDTDSLSAKGQMVEAVYIPEDDRATLCVSTQAGCKMGCRFCMTGTLGFQAHLTAADILNQIFYFDLSGNPATSNKALLPLTNIVYMGEGEPMDNIDEVLRSLTVLTADYGCGWSPKRVTVSSVGVMPGLKRFIEESECHLAISLHNPFGVERSSIMPAERMLHMTDLIALLKQYDWNHQRRVSFEYICWHGKNDTPRHANELLRLLKGLPCRINLIRFHEGVEQVAKTALEERSFPSSDEKQMVWMRDYLTQNGITTTIRRSRGQDIQAACGMLIADV